MHTLKYWLAFSRYVLRHYFNDDCNLRAAALTYTSLFAIVPLLTVMYTVLALVPYFQGFNDQIETFLFSHLLPSSGQEVQTYLHHFTRQAQQLTGIGIAFLAITAWLMLQSIEESFAVIWKSAHKRRRLRSFIMHWVTLSLGPVLISATIIVITYIASLEIISDFNGTLLPPSSLVIFIPYALITLAFSVVYSVIPNAHVPLKHAVSGGILTTLGFELSRSLFTQLMGLTSIELIYGTFAAIPLFLIWVYTSWVMVLLGAEFVHALHSYPQQALSQEHIND